MNNRTTDGGTRHLGDLSEMDRLVLHRLCQAGGSRAGRALCALLNEHRASVELYQVGIQRFGAANLHLQEKPSKKIVAVLFDLTGNLQGHLAMLLSESCATLLAGQLLGGARVMSSSGELRLVAREALAEVGNIVASAYLNVFADALKKPCLPSPPTLIHAPEKEVFKDIGLTEQKLKVLAIAIEAHIEARGELVRGQILFAPTGAFLGNLLSASDRG